MSKPLWISLAIAALGGSTMYGAGCGSSSNDNTGTGNQGGACCSCSSPECNTARTVSPPAGIGTIPNCTTYCQAQASFLANCSAGTAATIVGVGVACPKDGGVTSTGAGGSTGLGGSIGAGGSVGVGGSTGLGGTGASGTQTVDAGAAAILGKACGSDADCGGLHCSRVSDNDLGAGAGVPNGMCTLNCISDTNDPNNTANNPCSTVGGACILFTTISATVSGGLCVPRCDFANPLATSLGCQGRTDQACFPFTSFSACVPICQTDADCGGSRKCDIGSGACMDQLGPNKLGSLCTQDADCGTGICLSDDPTATTGPGVCSAFCRLGSAEGCGYRRTTIAGGPGPVGSCFIGTSAGTEGPEDVGLCFQLCDVNSDCTRQTTDWGCFTSPSLTTGVNHGACTFLTPADGGTD